MMLRKAAERAGKSHKRRLGLVSSDSRRTELSYKSSVLRRIVTPMAAVLTATVSITSIVVLWLVSALLKSSVDAELNSRATALLTQPYDLRNLSFAQLKVDEFREYYRDTRVLLRPAGSDYVVGDDLPRLYKEDVNESGYAVATINGERVLSKTSDIGATVVLAKDMANTHQLIVSLGVALLIFAFLALLFAIGAVVVASRSALKPLGQLRLGLEHNRRAGEVKPIHVKGTDEIASLARTFNEMLRSLEESRMRQADFVADAGHELKTSLTSMRANIEFLMMVHNSGGDIDESGLEALESDVIAQMEELSTLIGDLVDLARDERPEVSLETVDFVATVEAALSRAVRRGKDVEFRLESSPWYLHGDSHALERAMLNLMDNAAKWSPQGGVVRIEMTPLFDGTMQVTVSDSGPGIPEEDRDLVFHRFFRSAQAGLIPGSGLGLAIAQHAIHRHNGTIAAEESTDGGAMMRVILPGAPEESEKLAHALNES